MLKRIARSLLPFAAVVATNVGAQVPTFVSSNGVSGTDFGGSLSLLNDGVYPPDGTQYQTNTVHDFNSSIYFDFAFGSLMRIGSYNLTVDNNDTYTIAFFNGNDYTGFRQIVPSYGNVSEAQGGVETFTSDPSHNGTYVPILDPITPFVADHVRITAQGGDGLFSIAEAEFFAASVPEPAVWTTMILGFGVAGVALRRRVRRSEAAFDARIRAIAAGEEPA